MSRAIDESLAIAAHEPFVRPAVCQIDPCGKVNIWVRLLRPLSPFCYYEALLLCQVSETRWTAWVPDHGETTLQLGQFCVSEGDLG